jgi:hypothetical protein
MALPPVSDVVSNPGAPRALRTRRIAPSLSVVFAALGAVATALLPAPPAHAVDYSNDPLDPTVVSPNGLGQFIFEGQVDGINAGQCSTTGNCFDYVTINIPAGRQVTEIILDSYNSTDERAFIAIQAGSQFTATVAAGRLPEALAYNHFGWRGLCATSYGALRPPTYVASNNCILPDNDTPNPARLTDLFDSILPGSSRLPTSLPPGDYTFWIQQVSGDSEYKFLVTSSVPGPLPLLGAAAGFNWTRRLRRRVKQGQGA